jgi:hypothetical protein
MNNEEGLSPRFGGDVKKEEEEIIEKIQTFELNHKSEENLTHLANENKLKSDANFQLSLT